MDVAARNVLVHTDNLVKISDFGLVCPANPRTATARPAAHPQTQRVDPVTKCFQLKKPLKLAVRWMSADGLRPGGSKFSGTHVLRMLCC